MGEQRLFIGNLPNDTSECELLELFRAYQVSNLEIKRKKVFDGETVFAYVNVPHKRVNKCLRSLNNYHWKNSRLKIEIAKENFLDRLNKERTEKIVKNEIEEISKSSFISCESNHFRQNKKIVLNFNEDLNDYYETKEISEHAACDLIVKKNVENCNVNNIPRKGNLPMFCGTGSVKCDEVQSTCPTKKICDLGTEFSMKKFEEFSDVWKDNIDGEVFRYPNETEFTGSNQSNKPLKNGVERNAKYVSELKRKAAVDKKWSSDKERKSTIRKALKNINSSAECNSNSNLQNTSIENTQEKRANKIILFTEDSSDEEEDFEPNFELKPYLDGKSGVKMLEMRAKLASDNRFKLDDRFFDSDRSGIRCNAGENNRVLNRPIIYYDPTKPTRKILEKNLKANSAKTEKRRKSMKKQEDETLKNDIGRPEVSQKKHYIVSDNLKEAFKKTKEKSSFSFTFLFDNWFKSDMCTSKVDTNSDISAKKRKLIKNPLEEVSEPESEVNAVDEETPLEISSVPKAPEKILGKCGVWGESFFFKADDSRLKEAQCFYLPSDIPENKDFSKKRRNLKVIVKKKLQNSRRDKKLFKQKLGGKINRTKFSMRLKKVSRDH